MLERRTPQEISLRKKAESDLVKLRGEFRRLDSLAPHFPSEEIKKRHEEIKEMIFTLVTGMLSL